LRAGTDMNCGKVDRGKTDRGKRALAHRARVPAHHLPSRCRAQSLQFKPSVTLTFALTSSFREWFPLLPIMF
jgi:hypothetical protein